MRLTSSLSSHIWKLPVMATMTSVSLAFLFCSSMHPVLSPFLCRVFSQSSNWPVSFIWTVRGILEEVLPFNSGPSSFPILVGNILAVHFLLIFITFVLIFKFRNFSASGRSDFAAKAKNWIFKHRCFSVPVVAGRVLEQSPWVHLMQCSCSWGSWTCFFLAVALSQQ